MSRNDGPAVPRKKTDSDLSFEVRLSTERGKQSCQTSFLLCLNFGGRETKMLQLNSGALIGHFIVHLTTPQGHNKRNLKRF